MHRESVVLRQFSHDRPGEANDSDDPVTLAEPPRLRNTNNRCIPVLAQSDAGKPILDCSAEVDQDEETHVIWEEAQKDVKEVFRARTPHGGVILPCDMADEFINQISTNLSKGLGLPGSPAKIDIGELTAVLTWAANWYFAILLSDLARCGEQFQDHLRCTGPKSENL